MHLSAAIYGPKKYSDTIDLIAIPPGWMSAPPVWGKYDFSKKFLFVHYDYILGKISSDKKDLLNTTFEVLGDLRSMMENDIKKVSYNSAFGIVGLKTNVHSHKEWALNHFSETVDRIVVNDLFNAVLPEKSRLNAIKRARNDYRFEEDVTFTIPEVLSCIEDPLKGQVPHTLEEFKAQFVWHYYRPALERLREVVAKDEDMKTLIRLI